MCGTSPTVYAMVLSYRAFVFIYDVRGGKGKKVKLPLCFFFKGAPRHEGVLGNGSIVLLIL